MSLTRTFEDAGNVYGPGKWRQVFSKVRFERVVRNKKEGEGFNLRPDSEQTIVRSASSYGRRGVALLLELLFAFPFMGRTPEVFSFPLLF